jgi:hypothetical protein
MRFGPDVDDPFRGHEDRDGVASKRSCFRPLRDHADDFLLSRRDSLFVLVREQTDTCGPDLHRSVGPHEDGGPKAGVAKHPGDPTRGIEPNRRTIDQPHCKASGKHADEEHDDSPTAKRLPAPMSPFLQDSAKWIVYQKARSEAAVLKQSFRQSSGLTVWADTPLNCLYETGDAARNFVDTNARVVLEQAPGDCLGDAFEHGRGLIGSRFEQLSGSEMREYYAVRAMPPAPDALQEISRSLERVETSNSVATCSTSYHGAARRRSINPQIRSMITAPTIAPIKPAF